VRLYAAVLRKANEATGDTPPPTIKVRLGLHALLSERLEEN